MKESKRGPDSVEEPIFHDFFKVNVVDEWRPKSSGGEQIGWVIYHSDSDDRAPALADLVSFADLKGITPELGDSVHIRRAGDWNGRRLSIEVVKQQKAS